MISRDGNDEAEPPQGGDTGAPPPGKGDSLKDASKEAVEEIEKRTGTGHAGAGDIG